MNDSPPSFLVQAATSLFQLTAVLAVCWWLTRRNREAFNALRVLTITALAIAVGSLPFLAAWCIFPGHWGLLGAAVCAPLVPVYAVGIMKLIRMSRDKESHKSSSLHPPSSILHPRPDHPKSP